MWDRMLEKKSGAEVQFLKGNHTYSLIDVAVFPNDERLKYEIDETQPDSSVIDLMKADIEEYVGEVGSTIKNYISETSTSSAAMVVTLGDDRQKISFVKLYKSKKGTHPPLYWQTSVFGRETGWIQTGKGKSATSKAAEIEISPYHFIQSGQRVAIRSLSATISENLKRRSNSYPQNLVVGLPALANDLLKNKTPIPVPNVEAYQDQIEVVFGESMAPISLNLGRRVTGAYKECEVNLLNKFQPPLNWSDFKEVEFGGFGEKIGDSFMYAGNVKMIVSSKNKKGGAPASLTGAMETVDKYPKEFGPGTRFEKKYPFINILRDLHENTAVNGILVASVSANLINEDEKRYIESIYGRGTGSLSQIKKFPNLPTIYNAKQFIGQNVKNSKGELVVSQKGVDLNNPKFQMGYHLLGNLAKKLKEYLNQDLKLITEFFRTVLNKASMVQVYTHTNRNKNGVWFEKFDVTWPPTFTGSIIVESDYYTSNAKPTKKIGFKFV